MTCDKCNHGSAIYDFSLLCCRVRYILCLPTTRKFREMRAGYLERWREQYGDKAADETQAVLMERWDARKRSNEKALQREAEMQRVVEGGFNFG